MPARPKFQYRRNATALVGKQNLDFSFPPTLSIKSHQEEEKKKLAGLQKRPQRLVWTSPLSVNQHFNELSAHESETQGSHFLSNT